MLGHALSFHSQTITHSITNNGCSSPNKAAQPKQWLLASTYCSEARSRSLTLLLYLLQSTYESKIKKRCR